MKPKRKLDSSGSSRVLKILLIVLAVLLVIAGALFIFVQVKLGAINRLKPASYIDGADVSAGGEIPEGIDWGDAGVATSVKGVVNILLVGQDSRTEARERSDSMIILSVNTNSDQITMISLMRDLYVQVPDYGGRKINAAYKYGGFDLLDQTIADNLGIAIDYNVEVDFTGFKEIVNTLGGIDLELTQEEADYINENINKINVYYKSYLTEGVNHMTGQQALWYARTRKVGNSDFERTQRQRIVLKTIYNELKDASWLQLLDVYDTIAENVTTDMTNNQILSIAFSAYTMGADMDDINSYRIPADGMYYTERISGLGEVLIPGDWNETRQLIRDYLYSDDGGAAAFAEMEEKYGYQSNMDD